MVDNSLAVIETMDLPKLNEDQVKVFRGLGQIVKTLQAEISPENIDETNLTSITHIIDAHIILDYLTDVTRSSDDPNVIPDDIKKKALIPIDWLDGMPVIEGLPIWERLDCEPLPYYKLFKMYRNQKYIGVARNNQNDKESKDEKDSDPIRIYRRSFDNLEKVTHISRSALYALSWTYHWQIRIKFYDFFREDLVKREKDRLIDLMENKHRAMAEKVFNKFTQYLDELDDKKLKKIEPQQWMTMVEWASQLDRISMGLPKDKPKEEAKESKKTPSITVTNLDNRSVTISGESGSGNGNGKSNTDVHLQQILDILDNAGALPKAIIAKADVHGELNNETKETKAQIEQTEQTNTKEDEDI